MSPAMLSAGVWSNLFQNRSDVVGQSILIDDTPHTIVGVMPRRFWFGAMDGPVWTRLESCRNACVFRDEEAGCWFSQRA